MLHLYKLYDKLMTYEIELFSMLLTIYDLILKNKNLFTISRAYEGSPIRWHELDDDYPQELPKGLERHCMAYVDNTIYFIGGICTNLQLF